MTLESSGDLIVRLAHKRRDVASAQALRYRVFYREMGACANLRTKVWRRDIDRFDRACDHLLVIDRARRKRPPAIFGQVVGTCRLIRRPVADRQGSFYSEGEFDLRPLLAQPGECLELGRSCVDPDYRSRAVIDRLWSGIADYIRGHGGLAIGHWLRPCYAWYGDMALAPHLWSVLGLPGAEVELCLHDPVPATAFASRKALADHAEREVIHGLATLRQAA